jgi:hypothetical protein
MPDVSSIGNAQVDSIRGSDARPSTSGLLTIHLATDGGHDSAARAYYVQVAFASQIEKTPSLLSGAFGDVDEKFEKLLAFFR